MALDVGGIFGTIELRYDKAIKALNAVEKQTKDAMGRMSAAVAKHQQAIQGAGLALVAMGAAGILLGRKLVQAAGQMERYEAQFKVLTGSTEAAKARLKELVDFAAKTPFDLPGIIEASLLISALGLEIGTTTETLTLLGDAAAALGMPMDLVVRAMFKAREGMYDLNEMGKLLPKTSLRELGVEFSKTGEIMNREDLFPAAIKLLKRFEGTMDEVSKTTEGKLSNLSDSLFQLAAAFGEALTPAVKKYAEQISRLADRMEAWTKQNREANSALVLLSAKLSLLLIGLGSFLGLLPRIIAGFTAIIAAVSSPVGLIAALAALTAGIYATARAWGVYRDAQERARAHMDRQKELLKQYPRAAEEAQKILDAEIALAAFRAKMVPAYGTKVRLGALPRAYLSKEQKKELDKLKNALWDAERAARAADKAIEDVVTPKDKPPPGLSKEGAKLAERLREEQMKLSEAFIEGLIAQGKSYAEIEAAAGRYYAKIAVLEKDAIERRSKHAAMEEKLEKVRLDLKTAYSQLVKDLPLIEAEAFGDERRILELRVKAWQDTQKKIVDAWLNMMRVRLKGKAEELAAIEQQAKDVMARVNAVVKAGLAQQKSLWGSIRDEIKSAFSDVFLDLMKGTASFLNFFQRICDAMLRYLADRLAAMVAAWIDAEYRKRMEATKTALYMQSLQLASGEQQGGGGNFWEQLGLMAAKFFMGGGEGMASGGIVTKPTIAMLGEKGPEAVIPLSQAQPAFASASPVNITIQAIDTQTGAAFLMRNRDSIARAVLGSMRDNSALKRRVGL